MKKKATPEPAAKKPAKKLSVDKLVTSTANLVGKNVQGISLDCIVISDDPKPIHT